MNDEQLQANRENWSLSYENFRGWGALPNWGPYEVAGDDPSLVGEIEGRTFLEVACGSGHSVKYLLDRGAKKVYGLDFSEEQIRVANEVNEKYVAEGKAVFLVSPMENSIELPEQVDVVLSIYGVGWTVDPDRTFKNIYSYLKSGGKFVWSWDHSVLSDVELEAGKIVVEHSYHDESTIHLKKWSKGEDAYLTYRKTSTWFELLRKSGFSINRYLEPEAPSFDENIALISGEKMAAYYAPEKVQKVPWVFIFECFK